MLEIKKLATSTGHNAALYALATGQSAGHVLSAGGDGWIVEWSMDDPDNGRLVASVETRLFSLCAIPERQLVIAGNMDGGVHFIQRGAPDQTRNIQHHQKGVFDLLHKGDQVLSAGGDGRLSRWSLTEFRSLESLHLSAQALRCIALHPTRPELAVGASDGHIYLLDFETFEIKKTITGAHSPSVFTVAWHPDGERLLSGGRDAMLRVWDINEQAEPLQELPAHWFTLNHIAFSPDGRYFATASRDKTLKIWDAADFQLLKVVDTIRHGAHINSINRIRWMGERHLVTCSDDRSVMWWAVEEGQ